MSRYIEDATAHIVAESELRINNRMVEFEERMLTSNASKISDVRADIRSMLSLMMKDKSQQNQRLHQIDKKHYFGDIEEIEGTNRHFRKHG
mmetsp:Transcript_19095/g.23666  ORF Transcript_19095/g.23666 Transcript_19095/m.23666 type:complete len:91 (+) Transcript_19095:3-275(+)